jgi:cytochrome bd-type quinol oxidase subunit 2
VHFVGLHALQALPLLAWLSQRAAPARRARLRRWALGGACAYAALFMAVAVRTAIGHSAFAMTGPAWWLLAAPGLLFVLSAAAIVRAGGRSQVV